MAKIEKPFKQGADFEHLRKVIMRETTEGPVPIIEMGVDGEVMAAVTGIDFPSSDYNKLKTMYQAGSLDEMDQETMEIGMRFMDLSTNFSKMVGYDYVTATPVVPIRRTRANLRNDPNYEETVRTWQDEHQGLIMSRQDYDAYTWPSTDSINIMSLDLLQGLMQPGMQVLCFFFKGFIAFCQGLGVSFLTRTSTQDTIFSPRGGYISLLALNTDVVFIG